jgi:phenol 2-monooxygenase (NADPH)
MQFHLNGFNPGDPDVFEPAEDNEPASKTGDLPTQVDVLIAGCGPAGLCLAAQLSMFPEIKTMIVEPKSGPMEKGQADGINVRSMEMFQAFGFAEKIKRESVWINETTFWKPDLNNPQNIIRNGRIQDVEDGLSEMPHVLMNQARVHDMFLDIMRNSPTRLVPNYRLKVLDLKVEADTPDYPVAVTIAHTDPDRDGQTETVRARYVVGCDGARSNVRTAIGGVLHGDAAHQAWGVMDVLAKTDFPDIRMKSIIQSSHEGNILVLPREGGFLVRFYVELDKLNANERVANRDLTIDNIIAAANRILPPYSLDVKEVVWWSIYEIGHRLTDKFDDVPSDKTTEQTPRVFTAGDACHTHSPKAGQGMNVSMGDTFNLGWKLISVLTGRADPGLLHTYSSERWAAAKGLVDFDHEWSRVVSAPPGKTDPNDASIPQFQKHFIEGGRFTAGLTIRYDPSALTGGPDWQHLATGFEIGTRFHSAPVIRLADAKPMQLGHVVTADARWRVFVFSGEQNPTNPSSAISKLCNYLENDPQSPLSVHTPQGADIDAVIDVNAVFQQGFRDLKLENMPPLLTPGKGKYGLTDYEKIYCADQKNGPDIFDLRGVNCEQGCVIIVRPDQYIGHILPLDAFSDLADFFRRILLDQSKNKAD